MALYHVVVQYGEEVSDMARTGYLNLRITPTRASQLDVLRRHFGRGGKVLTNQEAIDFAIAWCIASMPDRLSSRRATPVIRAVKDATTATEEFYAASRSRRVRAGDLKGRAGA